MTTVSTLHGYGADDETVTRYTGRSLHLRNELVLGGGMMDEKRCWKCYSVLLFTKLNKIIFGYFDPEKIFLDNENK